MFNAYMNEQDVPSAKEAEAFVTVGEQRYNLLNAKNFEGKANISTKEIPVLGKIISGRKPTGMVVQAKMTVYKCSEMFDRIVTEYKNTGHLPVFELQTTNNDAATCMGRSTKVYHNCVIDGDVLLSMFDAEGGFVEPGDQFLCCGLFQPGILQGAVLPVTSQRRRETAAN